MVNPSPACACFLIMGPGVCDYFNFSDKIELHFKDEGVVIKEFRIPDRNRKKQPVAGVRVVNGEFDRFAPSFLFSSFTFVY